MDTETHKIFIKGEDLTRDILLIEPDGNKINVMFKNGRSYSYSRSSIRLEPIKQDEQRAKKSEKMKEMIADQLGVSADEVTETASFKDDLGADSLDLFELVMALEEEYGIEIPTEDLEQIATVGDVISYIESHKE